MHRRDNYGICLCVCVCLYVCVCVLLVYMHAANKHNPVHAAPTQKGNGNTVRVETLRELRHTAHNDSRLLVTSLSRGVVLKQV